MDVLRTDYISGMFYWKFYSILMYRQSILLKKLYEFEEAYRLYVTKRLCLSLSHSSYRYIIPH